MVRFASLWLALAALMSANGVLRELVFKPRMSPQAADVLSAILGVVIILSATWIGLRDVDFGTSANRWLVSLAFVALTVAFELVFGHYVDGKTWSELAENYAIWHGRLWPIALLSFAASPFLWGRATYG